MIVKNINTSRSITLDEFCAICDSIGEIACAEDYDRISEPLVALANNKDFLLDFIYKDLECVDNYQIDNDYNIQSILMARRKHYDVRVNFWPSSKDYELSDKRVSDFLAYNYPHDHNFHFITTSFTNDCYETDVYNYTYNKYEIGESISLSSVGRYRLMKGMIMIYETSKDIHTQFAPKDMSISINVIPRQQSNNNQYVFDLEQEEITGVVEEGSPVYLLSYISNKLGNTNLLELIEEKYKWKASI